jgi:hypothetical protein
MKSATAMYFALSMLSSSIALAAAPTVGAAPRGDATAVASKIIKYNFPACRRVSNALRAPDGSIRARCDGQEYLVFTVFDRREGKTIEVALNCAAAKKHLNVSC